MKRRNLKTGWKSTLTGILILMASLAYLFVAMVLAQPVNYYVFVTGLIFGVLLLFSPDTLINKIESFSGKFFGSSNSQNQE